MSLMGHERRFRDVRYESALTPTPERLRQRSETTLRAMCGRLRVGKSYFHRGRSSHVFGLLVRFT
jgi:hypothetical protein